MAKQQDAARLAAQIARLSGPEALRLAAQLLEHGETKFTLTLIRRVLAELGGQEVKR